MLARRLAQIDSLREGTFSDLVRHYVPLESVEEQWNIAGLEDVLQKDWRLHVEIQKFIDAADSVDAENVLELVVSRANEAFQAKINDVGAEQFTPFMRMVLLQSIDSHWREHLSALDYLRQGIHLRGYAQKQPKQEYKREAFELFGQLLDQVKEEVTRILMTVEVQSGEQLEQAAHKKDHYSIQ